MIQVLVTITNSAAFTNNQVCSSKSVQKQIAFFYKNNVLFQAKLREAKIVGKVAELFQTHASKEQKDSDLLYHLANCLNNLSMSEENQVELQVRKPLVDIFPSQCIIMFSQKVTCIQRFTKPYRYVYFQHVIPVLCELSCDKMLDNRTRLALLQCLTNLALTDRFHQAYIQVSGLNVMQY